MRPRPFPRSHPSSSSSSSLVSSSFFSSSSRTPSLPSKPVNKAQELRDHLADVIQGIVHNTLTALPAEDTLVIGRGITSPGLVAMSQGIVLDVYLPSNVQVVHEEDPRRRLTGGKVDDGSISTCTASSSSSTVPRLPLSIFRSTKSSGVTAQYHTLLTAACYNGNRSLVHSLLSMKDKNGIHINEISKSGIHPFLAACYGGHNDLVEYLLRNYASSSSSSLSSSRTTSRLTSEEILDVNIALPMGSMGKTAIEAAICGDIDRIRGWKYYMGKSISANNSNMNDNSKEPSSSHAFRVSTNAAENNHRDSPPTSAALTIPFPFPTLHSPRIIETLLKYGLSLTGQDYYHRLPFQIALDYRFYPGCSILLQGDSSVLTDSRYNHDNEGQNFISRFEKESARFLQQEFPSSSSPLTVYMDDYYHQTIRSIEEIQCYVQRCSSQKRSGIVLSSSTASSTSVTASDTRYASSSSSSVRTLPGNRR